MSVSSSSAPPLGATLVAVCRTLLTDLFIGYRPERHYMRGPGPKWREKNLVNHVVMRPSRSMRPQLARIRIRI
jgi:hypothetical protein